jgi:hypothetical protein
MAQNLRPIPNYVEGEVTNDSDWRAAYAHRVGHNTMVARRHAEAAHVLPDIVTTAVAGIERMGKLNNEVVNRSPFMAETVWELEQEGIRGAKAIIRHAIERLIW